MSIRTGIINWTIISLLILISIRGYNQSIPDTVKYLETVVVSASKTPQPVGNVTQKMDVVTSEELGDVVSGNRNLSEFIRFLPGNSVSVLSRNDANWGSYGGLGPKYSVYMLQGLPIDAFTDPMGMAMEAVERVEVQRGPASVLYNNYLSQDFAGSQSPLTGTVNLVMKEKVEKSLTRIGSGVGTYNTWRGSAYHQNRFGQLHITSGLNFEKSDYTNFGSAGSWLNMIDHPQYTKGKIFLGMNYFPGKPDRHKITLFFNTTMHNGDAGRPNRGYDHLYTLLNLGYAWKISTQSTLQIKTGLRYYNRSWEEDMFHYTELPYEERIALASDNGVKQVIVPADISWVVRHFGNSTLTVGLDHQHAGYKTWTDPVWMENSDINDAMAIQSGLYAQEEFRTGEWIFRAGARYNSILYDIKKLSEVKPVVSKKEWSRFLWNAGIKYKTSFGVSPFMNAGTSFVTPGLKSTGGTIPLSDMYLPGRHGQLPNYGLKPESGLGMDLGFDMAIQESGLFSARLFQNIVDDAIVENIVSQDPSQTQSINAGKTTSSGAEFSLKYRITDLVEMFVNYTVFETEISNPADTSQNGAQIPFVPENVANFGFTLNLPGQFKMATYVHVGGKMYDSADKYVRSAFTTHEIINLHISKKMNIKWLKGFQWYLDMYNLTNNQYLLPWQFQDPGFSFMTGISLEF